MTPKISVVIPTYNDSKTIERAIKSVLAQSFNDLEIIVIDDGSIDDTKNTLNSYIESKTIKYLYQNNSGVSCARNNGVNIASGDYIAFLDSDDEWTDKDKIKIQLEFLENNPDYVLVGTGVINVDSNGHEITRYLMPETDREIRKKLLRINCFVNSSVLFKKSSYKAIDGSTGVLEDYDLWLKIGSLGKLANLNRYSVKYLAKFSGYGSRNKIKRLKENLALSKKYKKKYPNYFQALILGYFKLFFYPLFGLLPLRIKAVFIKLHKKL